MVVNDDSHDHRPRTSLVTKGLLLLDFFHEEGTVTANFLKKFRLLFGSKDNANQ